MTDFDDLVVHMHRVRSGERDLRDLGVLWQMIESSAAISCPDEVAPILPTRIQTRERFNELQQQLIARMVGEQKAALGDELMAAAQCAIDILVRNLYERTADIGFLATDDVLLELCSGDAEFQQPHHAAMVARVCDYQSKCTVYGDVILLSPAGEVLVRLDGNADLGRNVGALVLKFRFLDEMRRIFNSGDGQPLQEVALVLIDEVRRVIAPNDDGHVPPRTRCARRQLSHAVAERVARPCQRL